MKQRQIPLTEEEKSLVRRWAAEGVSYREIGKRLGRTKDSIVGHVHRLGLPGRPSPIIRTGPRIGVRRHRRNGQPLAVGKSEMPALPSINGTQAPEPASMPEPKPAPRPPMKWSKPQDELLIELRRNGEPWNGIGARFGVTGHAAEHRARRLGVPRTKEKRDPTDSEMGPNTLPALESQMQATPPDIGVIQQLVDAFAKRRRKRQREPKIIEVRGCRYPMWGNWERPTHEFCNEICIPGKSWCRRHYRVVFSCQSMRDEAIA